MSKLKHSFNVLFILALLLSFAPTAGNIPAAPVVQAAPVSSPADLTGFPQSVRSVPAAPLSVTAPTTHTWHLESLPSTVSASTIEDVTIDDAGNIHFVYDNGGDTLYGYYNATQWLTETLPLARSSTQKWSLTVDHQGTPHIVNTYRHSSGTFDLYYTYREGTQWITETVVTNYAYYDDDNLSIAVDSAGWPHISDYGSYMDELGNYKSTRLSYMYKDETGWHTSMIAGGGFYITDPAREVGAALALDKEDQAHIVYVDPATTDPNDTPLYQMIHWVAGQGEVNDYGRVYTPPPSYLSIDSTGLPHFIYIAGYPGDEYNYMSNITAIPLTDNVRHCYGPALDIADRPHFICTYNGSDLKYARLDGAQWFVEDVVPTINGFTIFEETIAIDSQGRLHAILWDTSAREIKYLWTALDMPYSLSKTVAPTSLAAGDPLTYTLRVSNNMTGTMTHIVVTDTLPADVLNPQVSSNIPITLHAGTQYVWDMAPLSSGTSGEIIITGQSSATPSGDSIVNAAQFSSNFGNHTAEATAYFPGVLVTKTGTGQGRVTSNPPGIDCGAECSQGYPLGTVVTLTATPEIDHKFCGWSGSGCSGTGTCEITVSTAHLVEAHFAAGQYCDATIIAVRNGDWNNSRTWSAKRKPHLWDIVEIPTGITVIAPQELLFVTSLYQDGTLLSARNAPLRLRVWQTLSNTGTIRGQDGVSTIGATCGASGSDVSIKGMVVYNYGVIQGGNGRGGGCCGGNGGNVSITETSLDNQGRIQGGTGADVADNASCCTNGSAGKGGHVILFNHRGYMKISGEVRSGAGGDQAQCGGFRPGGCAGNIGLANTGLSLQGGKVNGGDPSLNSDGTYQECGGDIIVDPDSIVVSDTHISSVGLSVFGGMNWTMALTDTATGMISATQAITLAVGTGGSIDLRGCEAGAFTAPRFFIASDNVLLDAGQSLADVVSATQIVQTGAQILGDIAISAPGYLRGERGESFDIPIELVNNSPIAFTYDLVASSGSGLPAIASIEPVSSTVVTLTVSAPALGGEQPVTVTATAQASPFQSASTVIRLYAPPETAEATLDQTFTGGVFYPFTGTLNCGGVTFASTWTGQLGVTMGEVASSAGLTLLPQVYTITVSGTPSAATLALCYDESAAEGAGIYADTPLAFYHNGAWLPATRAEDDALVTGATTLPGVFRIGVQRYPVYLPLVLR